MSAPYNPDASMTATDTKSPKAHVVANSHTKQPTDPRIAKSGDATRRASHDRKMISTYQPHTPRPVSLPASAIAALNAHRKRQDKFRHQFGPDYRADLDLIFANPDGTPLKPDSISASVSLLFRRLKLHKGTSLHSLRHTHTSHLLASGVPLPAVSARLGHGSIRTTQEIYSHMIHGQDDEAAKRWEEFQQRNTGSQREPHQVV